MKNDGEKNLSNGEKFFFTIPFFNCIFSRADLTTRYNYIQSPDSLFIFLFLFLLSIYLLLYFSFIFLSLCQHQERREHGKRTTLSMRKPQGKPMKTVAHASHVPLSLRLMRLEENLETIDRRERGSRDIFYCVASRTNRAWLLFFFLSFLSLSLSFSFPPL